MTYFHHAIVDSPHLPRGLDGDSAQSAIVTLLGEFWPADGETWVPSAALVEILSRLGVSEAAARAALSRLSRRGTIDGLKSGRTTSYRLSADVRRTIPAGQQLTMSFGEGERDWDGEWTVVSYSIPEEQRERRTQVREWLRWLGFGAVRDGVWVAPHASLDLVLNSLDELLPADALIFRATRLRGEISAERIWPLDQLRATYDAFIAEFGPLIPDLVDGRIAPADALPLSLRVIGRWRGFPTVDPDLPKAALPDDWPRAEARRVFTAVHDAVIPLAAQFVRDIVARHDASAAEVVRSLSVAKWLEALAGAAPTDPSLQLDLVPRGPRRLAASERVVGRGRRAGDPLVEGTIAPGYESVRDAFTRAQSLEPGGAQLCVYRHGEVVVDLWTGRDLVEDRRFDEDSLVLLMSCTKTASSVCVGLLAQRGELELDAPVARYWPEFAAQGKGGITVARVLSHTAGLPGFPPAAGLTIPELADWERCIRILEDATPLWEPGTAVLYHAIVYGFLVGEIVRRVSGVSIGRFLAENVAGPLGIDLYLGLPPELEDRVATTLIPDENFWASRAGGPDVEEDAMAAAMRHASEFMGDVFPFTNTRAGREAELPSSNGIGNARAVAKMFAACIGEVDGTRLLDPTTVEEIRRPRTKFLPSAVPSSPAPEVPLEGYGLGVELGGHPGLPMLGPGSFGHSGAGGILGYAHPESGTAAAYTCVNMKYHLAKSWPDPGWGWNGALREIVESPTGRTDVTPLRSAI